MDLLLMTESFPYSKGEEFLETEIITLASRFNTVVIVPRGGDPRSCRQLPQNVSIDDRLRIKSTSKLFRAFMLLSNPVLVLRLLSGDVSGRNRRGSIGFPQIALRLSILADALLARQLARKYRGRDVKFYSYWGNSSALGLAIMSARNELRGYVVRLHGYDLYDERYINGGVPFRDYIARNAKQVACISETGKNYLGLKGEYGNLTVARLGVDDNGINPVRQANSNILNIVSCSSVISLKRVELIVKILREVTIPVVWMHIGDGPELNRVKAEATALGENIRVEFLGHKPNSSVMEIYRSNHFDLFIHMSETEGIPVSFMEAISFGIPIISTNVGGVSELVTDQTGILIDPDVNIKATAEILDSFLSSELSSERFRMKVKEFWHNNFRAETNYNKFYTEVLLHSF